MPKYIDEFDILDGATVNPNTGIKANATPKVDSPVATIPETATPLSAPATPYKGVKVRDTINSYGSQYGINDSMIGWDQGSQNVMLGGKSLIKADTIVDGRSWADEAATKAAIDKYAMENGLSKAAAQTQATVPTAGPSAPTAYNSPYKGKIDALLDSILNRGKFKYDVNTDPSFAAYKEQYGIAGDKALANTMSEASSLTGGRLNSWAMSAGQQAKSDYDQKLMAQVPQLEQNAYNRYQGDMDSQMNTLNAILGVDNSEYNRFSGDRGYNRDVFESDRNFDYTKETNDKNFDRGVVESDRNFDRGVLESDRTFDRGKFENDRNFNFDKDKFGYQKDQDKKAQQYQVTRDQILDSRWLKQFSADERSRLVSEGLQSRQISISEANAALGREEFEYKKDKDSKEKTSTDMVGAAYADMMKSPDPAKWLQENATYMTKDELKMLESMIPKIDPIDKWTK